MRLTIITTIAAVMAAAPALAEERRELGAHVHGHGTLNIAIEGNRVSMELEVPGMDIVGFEHAAESAEQKATVDKASKLLATPLALFKVPAAAGCTVAEAKVALESEREHGDDDHDHDAAAAKDAKGDHAKKEHEDHDEDEHAGHNAFHASYALDCAKPADIASITFDYFKSFAGARELTVNVVTAKAQSTYEVSRDKPTLDLGGMM